MPAEPPQQVPHTVATPRALNTLQSDASQANSACRTRRGFWLQLILARMASGARQALVLISGVQNGGPSRAGFQDSLRVSRFGRARLH